MKERNRLDDEDPKDLNDPNDPNTPRAQRGRALFEYYGTLTR